jgi:hypothetical protein
MKWKLFLAMMWLLTLCITIILFYVGYVIRVSSFGEFGIVAFMHGTPLGMLGIFTNIVVSLAIREELK